MKVSKYFGIAVLLVSTFFLTACFGGDSNDTNEPGEAKVSTEKGLKCSMKKTEDIGTSVSQVVLDYNDDATLITKYTKVDSVEFGEAYSGFVAVTEEQWKAACDENVQEFDSCVVTTEGKKVVMTGIIQIKADRQEEINENVYANTARDVAKANYENAGYTCE